MKILVGNTGFVGSNLSQSGEFDIMVNSKNVTDAFGKKPEMLFFAGVRAEKYIANSNPAADEKHICEAMENIKRISPRSVVLISTVDVYKHPVEVTETSEIKAEFLSAYGLNRYRLECFVRENFTDHLIVRLPGLYGNNLKKNFIFDMIHFIPSALTDIKIAELDSDFILKFYRKQLNGFYVLRDINIEERKQLTSYFMSVNFSALCFTDSRAKFQFYNLSHLKKHIDIAKNKGINLLNIVTEPCRADEIYRSVFNEEFNNELKGAPPEYNIKSIHAGEFGGDGYYIFSKKTVIDDISQYVRLRKNLLLNDR